MSSQKPATGSPAPTPRADPFSPRSMKQLSLLVAGSAFLLASIAVTRRSITRKALSAMPKSCQPNNRIPGSPLSNDAASSAAPGTSSGQGGPIAVEALGLATLNVFSFALFTVGGASYALDISSVDELRTFARRKMFGPTGKSDEEAERELEEWAAGVLNKPGRGPKGKENR